MGVQKFRSKVNYADIINGDREGIASGVDAFLFLREEAVPRVFNAPRIGTSGQSIGDTGASEDISAGSDDALDISVDGGAVVSVVLTLAGLTTGPAIEAELETKINSALLAAGQEGRVWVNFNVDKYEVYSQSMGVDSSVVITDAGANNVADDLKLGVANSGVEAVGTDDQDFLLYTEGGPTHDQPVDPNPHRTGRFQSGVVKKKQNAEFDITTMLNMEGTAGDSVDTAIMLLLKSTFGSELVVPGSYIRYKQGLPNVFFSIVKIGTIHGEYFTGGYANDMTLTAPGDAPVTLQYTGRAEKGSIAGIGKLEGAVVASDTVILEAGHSRRFLNNGSNNPARVMSVLADGETIVDGIDGSLTVASIDNDTNTMVLSAAIDLEDDGYIVPWYPGAVSQTARDAIFTDLAGSIKLNASGQEICATNIILGYTNNHTHFDNCFGAAGNKGFAAASKAAINLSVTVDLSNENLGDIVQARQFGGFDPVITIGETSGRHAVISAPKWIVSVPPIELPAEGVVPTTLEGLLYQSKSGARDPIQFDLK